MAVAESPSIRDFYTVTVVLVVTVQTDKWVKQWSIGVPSTTLPRVLPICIGYMLIRDWK
jgi:hypothetical protein